MKALKRLLENKYRELMISVTLFVLIDTGILGLNFYITTQLDSDAHAISIINRQSTLAEQILQSLYSVYVDSNSADAPYLRTTDKLTEPFQKFDETLDTMIYGGELIGAGQGADKLFSHTDYLTMNKASLDNIESLWKEYRKLLSPIANAYFNDSSRSDVLERTQKALAFANSRHVELSALLHDMSVNIESTTRHKVQTIRKVQAAGIVLAIANFALIIFHFMRKLKRSDAAAEKAEHETREILASVSDGLFLLDRQLIIGEQHSASLTEIIPADSLRNRHFSDVMRPFVTPKTLTTACEYIELLFTSHVEESLIRDLNPLHEVEIHIDNREGTYSVKHLQFSFKRTWENNLISHVLVSVSDITEAVNLRAALKKSENKAREDITLLTAILHLDPEILHEFLQSAHKLLVDINQVFRSPARNENSLRDKLVKAQRLAHKLKGDCSMAELQFMLERVHRFEEKLKQIHDKDLLCGDDFVGATVELNRLMTDLGNMHKLTMRLIKPESASNDSLPVQKNEWQEKLLRMASNIASDENKQVQLIWEGCSTDDLPETVRHAVQDIIVQCTRNAICHGIEATAERISLGKPAAGKVVISLQQSKSHINLSIRDDGAGINLKSIRMKAMENQIMTADKLENLDAAKLVAMIFQPNFSTARPAGLHAGRGIGLSLVRELLNQHKGSVSLKNKMSEFTQFTFNFPMEQTLRQTA